MEFLSGLGSGAQLKKLKKVADRVNMIEEDFQALSDAELREETDKFKERVADGEKLDLLMPEAFAAVREASVRVSGKRHFDVQLMGGAALHWGNIAEMKTGEGKTLVATLPSYLNALSGEGVHIVTTNDYLAKYQSEQMGRIHHFLGLSVGAILAQMTPAERREAYAADITYGTNNEFGFDYLRDNMALRKEDMVQRGHHYAIVDEVDSILIDEARTPLIISGPAQDSKEWFPVFARMVQSLRRDEDYEVDEKKRTVSILGAGIEKVEDRLGIDNLYESANTPLISYLNNAIKAKELFKRDKDYVVAGDEVLIVDEHTGRTLEGRRYNDGLHQSLEAKELVKIKDEYQTLATITLQNYFRMYDKLAGMTGTAKTEESEFQKIYGLGVITIPTNMPMIRIDNADLIYRTEQAKFEAIIDDVVERHEEGQPVLIGTASVEKSELLSAMLKRANVPHNVLNAKYHEKEAAIVAEAGRKGAVTVSTNMAGRGTDIMLGGNPEFLADLQLRKQGLDPVETPEEYEEQWPDTLKALEEQVASEHDEVKEAGGLYVVGSERHESRRIDNQLRGRSGRQGDPGESRFYLSLQDDLMRLFRPELLERAMSMLNVPDDVPIDSKMVSRQIEGAQKQVESQNFEMRKNVLKYDDVMNRQRHAIYGDRRRVLDGADVSTQLRSTAQRVVSDVVTEHTTGFPEEWDLEQLHSQLQTLYPVSISVAELEEDLPEQAEMVELFAKDVDAAYERREEEIGEERMRELERQVLLTVLDRKWREHLYEMDYLREGIGLRAMAQRDPLTEYQREGSDMFNAMMGAFMEEVVGYLFHLEVPKAEETEPEPEVGVIASEDGEDPVSKAKAVALAKGLEREEPTELQYSSPDESGTERKSGAQPKQAKKKPGRNQPCYCGSGKKYKACHGAVR
ncbi:preprotein translocase subunit SecA [uncultured Tessaracoccus sp.]|uniref:preprotein translocase subunit SecA n=1 Tax=uncultured Tessaracoccus sp. TaxID=905023 RepID=UPI0025EAADB6|nr:preprotein translocase subunit SecA [uncultured Tessaracoccus sp.]